MTRVLFSSLITLSVLCAATINIPDDYYTIQGGINASSNGDTVLVAQGTYVENLILEKEIVLASHAINDDLTDWMENEHIQNTVIVGNQPSDPKKGSCLQVSYGNIEPTIMGFTFSDGLGTSMGIDACGVYRTEMSGGAILAYQAYPMITYNRFINNGTSQLGGGNANGATIANGGAISLYDDDDVEFDEDRANSGYVDFADINAVEAYVLERALRMDDSRSMRDRPSTMIVQNNYFENNTSGNGENFYSHGYDGDIDVSGSVFENIDCATNTVNEFVLQSIENEANYVQNDIVGACIEGDIFYVSTDNGDDNNLGLDETVPLKTIRHALTLMKDDTDGVTTIYLEPGMYSREGNGEAFPIVLPDNVHLIGDEAESTILHAGADENNEAATMIIKEVDNVRVANLTLAGGYSEGHGCAGGGGLLITANDMYNLDTGSPAGSNYGWNNVIIENVIIENNESHNGGGLSIFRSRGSILKNVIIRNNAASAFGGGVFTYGSHVDMTNVTVSDNNNLAGTSMGGGMMMPVTGGTLDSMTITDNRGCCGGAGVWTNGNSCTWTMTNSIISGNTGDWGGGLAVLGGDVSGAEPTLINVTISNNEASSNGGAVWGLDASPTFENCTFTGNATYGADMGGAFWLMGLGSTSLTDCILTENTAPNSTAGIWAMGVTSLDLNRVIIAGNSGDYNPGVFISDAFDDGSHTPATLTNCTITGNYSTNGGAIRATFGGHFDVVNSIIYGNTTPDEVSLYDASANIAYSDVQGGWDGEGNIDANPLFTDTDYTLTEESPCVDAGTADVNEDGLEDIDYNGLAPDMGALELTMAAPVGFTLYPSSDYVILTWDAVEEDVLYYLLERSTNVEFSEDVVSNYLATTYFEDNDLEYNTEYFYRVSYTDFADSWSELSDIISVTLEWMSVDGNNLPKVYALHQNYPNPFNPVTNLSYDLPEDAMVNITIYDMMGQVVSTLVNDKQSAGFKTIQWNAINDNGQPISAGLYIYSIHTDDFSQNKKMILLK